MDSFPLSRCFGILLPFRSGAVNELLIAARRDQEAVRELKLTEIIKLLAEVDFLIEEARRKFDKHGLRAEPQNELGQAGLCLRQLVDIASTWQDEGLDRLIDDLADALLVVQEPIEDKLHVRQCFNTASKLYAGVLSA